MVTLGGSVATGSSGTGVGREGRAAAQHQARQQDEEEPAHGLFLLPAQPAR